ERRSRCRGRLPGRLGPGAGPPPLRPAVRQRDAGRRPRGGRRVPQPRRGIRLGPGAGPPVGDQPARRRAARVRGVRRRPPGDDRAGGGAVRLAGRGDAARRWAAVRPAGARSGGLRAVLGLRGPQRLVPADHGRGRGGGPPGGGRRSGGGRAPVAGSGDVVLPHGRRRPGSGARHGAGVRGAVPRRGVAGRTGGRGAGGTTAVTGARRRGAARRRRRGGRVHAPAGLRPDPRRAGSDPARPRCGGARRRAAVRWAAGRRRLDGRLRQLLPGGHPGVARARDGAGVDPAARQRRAL
ncbi:MAG: hypothetical protein AVDCRST_MAG57-94, partial [uncultured Blastococcus sp.]